MKTNITIILFLCCYCQMLLANENFLKQRQDSLCAALGKTTNPKNRIELLKKLHEIKLDTPASLKWIQQVRTEARKINSQEEEDWAIRSLTIYYYNAAKLDSVIHYAAQADSLAKEMGTRSKYYYETQAVLCQNLLWAGQQEKASDIAIRQFKQAKKDNNTGGIISLSETLGLINQQVGQDSIAVTYMTEGLELLAGISGKYGRAIQILNSIIESELRLQRFEDSRKHIKLLQEYLIKRKESTASFSYGCYYLLSEAYYINLNVQLKNAAEAHKHYQLAQPYEKDIDDDFVKHFYEYSLAAYYKLTRQFAQALDMIDRVLAIKVTPEAMKLKAEILFDKGDTREAAILYRKVLEENESRNVETFIRQISELRAIHDMNQLELEVKELRVKELELEAKQLQLKWTIALATLFFFILILGTVIYSHTNKLKNELQKDKQALLESEKALRLSLIHI